MRNMHNIKHRLLSIALVLSLVIGLSACGNTEVNNQDKYDNEKHNIIEETPNYDPLGSQDDSDKAEAISDETEVKSNEAKVSLVYTGEPWVVVNDNKTNIINEETTEPGTEIYSPLDNLGRCGVAYAVVGLETMPTEKRGDISKVKPTGWHSKAAANYNRCHLIGFQLCGENDNELNLITGTRYLNIDGMLPFENMVADYVKETSNHVAYRVTPVYTENNLVADGVYMEGYSIEDAGEGIEFNVYCFNVAPGVEINYLTGESWEYTDGADLDEIESETSENTEISNKSSLDKNSETEITESETYIINSNSKKIHRETCSQVSKISEENKETYVGDIQSLINIGYTTCGICKP